MNRVQVVPFIIDSVRDLAPAYRSRNPKYFWTDEEFLAAAKNQVLARWGEKDAHKESWILAEIRRAATVPLLRGWDRMIISTAKKHGRLCRLPFDEYYQLLVLYLWQQGGRYAPERGAYSTWLRLSATGCRRLVWTTAKQAYFSMDEFQESLLQADADNSPEVTDTYRAVMAVVDDFLDERSVQVLKLRYGLDGLPQMSLEAVSKELKISDSRVQQIQNNSLYRLVDWFKNSSIS